MGREFFLISPLPPNAASGMERIATRTRNLRINLLLSFSGFGRVLQSADQTPPFRQRFGEVVDGQTLSSGYAELMGTLKWVRPWAAEQDVDPPLAQGWTRRVGFRRHLRRFSSDAEKEVQRTRIAVERLERAGDRVDRDVRPRG